MTYFEDLLKASARCILGECAGSDEGLLGTLRTLTHHHFRLPRTGQAGIYFYFRCLPPLDPTHKLTPTTRSRERRKHGGSTHELQGLERSSDWVSVETSFFVWQCCFLTTLGLLLEARSLPLPLDLRRSYTTSTRNSSATTQSISAPRITTGGRNQTREWHWEMLNSRCLTFLFTGFIPKTFLEIFVQPCGSQRERFLLQLTFLLVKPGGFLC